MITQVKDVPVNYLFQYNNTGLRIWAKMSVQIDHTVPITCRGFFSGKIYYLVLVNIDESTGFLMNRPNCHATILNLDMTDRLQHRGAWLREDYSVINVVADYCDLKQITE